MRNRKGPLRSSLSLGFILVAVLVLAQISWWVYVFVHEVEDSAAAHRLNAQLESGISAAERSSRLRAIDRDFRRRENMFLSESTFFAVITCVGLGLLFRALRAERRAQEQEKSFIEIVTHESKTPLTALKLRLESIVENWSGRDPELRRELESARSEVFRLSQVVEKTVNLNRLEREGLTLQSVCLTDLIRETLKGLELFLRSKDVALSLDIEEEVWIYADASSIATSIQNLVENAVVYNDAERKMVNVRLTVDKNGVCVRIADNGPGVPEQERADIFERFHRGRAGKRVPGMGLGLYLARSVVSAHGGTLNLASQLTRGTAFEMHLPIARNCE